MVVCEICKNKLGLFANKIKGNKNYYCQECCFKTKKGNLYFKTDKIPNWVEKKWEDMHKMNSIFELESKEFYFKGDKYRYLIKTGMAMGQGGTSSSYSFSET